MASLIAPNRRKRRDFSSIKKVIEIPNLIELQKRSYEGFLQYDQDIDSRAENGLEGVFRSVFPIKDFNNTASLEFVGYKFDKPKYDVNECRQRGMTYESPIKVTVRLIVWDKESEGENPVIRDVKEQEVFFGTVPLMTKTGTFIINGTERVIVSQLHRSPGVFFEHDKGKTHASGKLLYSARVIPYRGSWLDLEFDAKDLLHVRIDRRRKMPATILLRALGYSVEEILNFFYPKEKFFIHGARVTKEVVADVLKFQRAKRDIKDSDGKVLIKKDRKITKTALKKLEDAKIKEIPVDETDYLERVFATDVINPETGEVIAACNQVLTEEILEEIRKAKITEVELLYIDSYNCGPYIRNTLLADKIVGENPEEEALIEIYRRLRPGDPSTLEAAQALFQNLFFNPDRYDLSKVGRLKMNHKFKMDVSLDRGTLSKEDILRIVKYLVGLKDGQGFADDIDHLGNRRVRAVGELLENQYRLGLVRMERAIKERMSLQDIETLMPNDLINAKPVSSVVKEFFGSSQLSQFMDQTNPLSEITHKRRLSALGPGGLTRERAGFEVRDVHATHYGRICPIETPEGPNIGLIASLSSFARVNEYGFIETPYRRVESGRVTDEIAFYTALDEEGHLIAQANAEVDEEGRFEHEFISCRKTGEFVMGPRDEVDLMDVSPNQLVSVAASLIPFLEHDDANRALMGSNMQRQAVPLLRSSSPLVGTGIESIVARDSGTAIVADNPGTVIAVDASRVVVKVDTKKAGRKAGSHVDIYNLVKYQRSNQNTCLNQQPLVNVGDEIEAGSVVADGSSTDRGELALGKNVTVAFMPWGGYNFEDSVLINERLVKEDVFTSIHVEEFECIARDTKLGKEEITRDIPNVGEEALKDLDESGIVRVGAEVKPGDILVGKITPKGETQLSPEEKLLRAIFGEKAGDVKDTSLRVGPGAVGTVISTQVFSREGVDLDERSLKQQEKATGKLQKDQLDELNAIETTARKKVNKLLVGQVASAKVANEDSGQVYIAKGKKITESLLNQMPVEKINEISCEGSSEIEDQVSEIIEDMQDQIDMIHMSYDQKVSRLKKGDELPPGVIKLVKVYVAIKRKMQVGDKVAGRHGNKGVISMILPEEDMPYMADGRPVDVVLNPLGVPSRMNVGQILETHLGWVGAELGRQIQEMLDQKAAIEQVKKYMAEIFEDDQEVSEFLGSASDQDILTFAKDQSSGIRFATPVFDGAKEIQIKKMLKLAEVSDTGQVTLFDGRTGDPFDTPVTVGMMYILKLHHLVDDKIHARSIGPYSLVTQQPLGGKAQFGGQRLGEMEVWAMEAYGAAYSLQEFLTIKSDDVIGRTRAYEQVVKGKHDLEPGIPESFNVLIKEMQSLALNIELIEDQ